jgi:hypothetical protein
MRARSELPAPELARFSAAQIEFARAAWPLRAAEELRSALIFRALADAARPTMDRDWSERFASCAADEVRHARLCATVGNRLGATAPSYDSSPVRRRLKSYGDPRRRVAALLVAEIAIGETISMCLFRAGRQATSEPLSRAALEMILADEVRHQQLGWRGLDELWPRLEPAERDALQLEAARALAASEAHVALPVLRRLEAGERFDSAWAALGVLDFEVRVDTFYSAVENLVLPKLSKLGLDGQRAWNERYR